MAFTINDFADLRHLLTEHPEWRVELRQLVLTDELLTLPTLVRELAEAQQRTEQRIKELAEAQKRTEEHLARLETAVAQLVEAQQRTEEHLARLETVVAELVEAQRRAEERFSRLEEIIAALAQAQQSAEQKLTKLNETLQDTVDRVGQLLGWRLEERYRQHAGVFWGKWLRPVEVVSPGSLRDTLETYLSEDEVDEVMRLDVLVRGRARRLPGTPEVWLALEVSAVIDEDDVERALRRAALLRKADYRAIPVVAGEGLTPEATQRLQDVRIALMLDGRSQGWDEALAAA